MNADGVKVDAGSTPKAEVDSHPILGVASYICGVCSAQMTHTVSRNVKEETITLAECKACGVTVDAPMFHFLAPVVERLIAKNKQQ